VQLLGGGQHHTLANQYLQRLLPSLGSVEQLGIDVGALSADPLDLLTMRLVPFGLCDRMTGHLGH
jgi:hypothetical protein